MKVNIGDYNVECIITRKNNKHLYFRVEDGILLVSCPKFMNDLDIIKMINKNNASLIKMYEKDLNNKYKLNEVYYLGNKYDIVIDKKCNEVVINDNVISGINKEIIDEYLLNCGKEVILNEVENCKKCFSKLPDFTVRFRKMKTRWGVCNTRDYKITLNTELIKKDIDVIDYVIIHEICHFYKQNHSKEFWEYVSMACPNYKELRKKLKQ